MLTNIINKDFESGKDTGSIFINLMSCIGFLEKAISWFSYV